MSIILFISIIYSGLMGEHLTKVNVSEEISMMIPASFRLMTDDEVASRYFTTKRPIAIYTNEDVTVDLGINRSATEWIADDLEIMVSFQKSNIYNFYDEIEMIDQGVKDINDQKAAYFEFVSTVKPEKQSFRAQRPVKKYTYIQYMIVDDNSWVFNFSCPVQLKGEWQSQIPEIMNSIAFTKSKK